MRAVNHKQKQIKLLLQQTMLTAVWLLLKPLHCRQQLVGQLLPVMLLLSLLWMRQSPLPSTLSKLLRPLPSMLLLPPQPLLLLQPLSLPFLVLQ
jgi:hypothetical protein